MKKPTSIVIADDHELILDGLKTVLHKEQDIVIVGLAKNGEELVRVVHETSPDVIVTDIRMPRLSGLDATRKLKQCYPDAKILALSILDNEFSVVEMLEAGALGYIIKTASSSEITEAIKLVEQGLPYYCDHTSSLLRKLIAESKFDPYKKRKLGFFDERERSIVKLICQEKTNQEIADELFLSVRTVEWYRLNLIKKVNARNVAGLIIYAIKSGLYQV